MGHVYLSLHKTVRAGGVPLQRLRAQVAVRYDFIVVDEAQDNNRMQNVIVQALCRAEVSDLGSGSDGGAKASFIISTEDVARDNHTIRADGWKLDRYARAGFDFTAEPKEKA